MKPSSSCQVISLLFLLCTAAYSELMEYTFTGTVSDYFRRELHFDENGNLTYASTTLFDESEYAESGAQAGVTATYQFTADTERRGYTTDQAENRSYVAAGTLRIPIVDPAPGSDTIFRYSNNSYFFSEYLSGDLLEDLTIDDNSSYNLGTTSAYSDYLSGEDSPFATGTSVCISGGSLTHFTRISNPAASIDEWAAGTAVTGFESSYYIEIVNNQCRYFRIETISTDLTLATDPVSLEVQDPVITPVPEPPARQLFVVSGLFLTVALAVFYPVKKKKYFQGIPG